MSNQSAPEPSVPSSPEQKNYNEKALVRCISGSGRPVRERVQDLCGDIEKLAGAVFLSRQPSVSQERIDELWAIFQGFHEKIGKELKYLRLLLEGAEAQATLAKVQERYDRLQVSLQPKDVKNLVEAGKELRQVVERMPSRNPPIEALTTPLSSQNTSTRKSSAPEDSFVLNELQQKVLEALDGKALKQTQLESQLDVKASQLHRDALRELKKRGLVGNDSRYGGYYRPDALPPEIEKLKNQYKPT